MDKFIPYIGIRYEQNKRTKTSTDCWGLIVLLYRELYQIELPTYQEYSLKNNGRSGLSRFIVGTDLYKECQKISINSEVKEGDLILIKDLGHDTHIGMAINNTDMIHCYDKAGSVIEPYRSHKWISRIQGIYRHPSLI